MLKEAKQIKEALRWIREDEAERLALGKSVVVRAPEPPISFRRIDEDVPRCRPLPPQYVLHARMRDDGLHVFCGDVDLGLDEQVTTLWRFRR